MTAAQKGLWILGGLILGALASWVLSLAYSLIDIDRGFLAVPFTLVALGGIALARRPNLRPLAFGLVAGAAVETAFFIWLFTEVSRGLEGL